MTQAPSLTDSCGRWRAASRSPRTLLLSWPARWRARPGSAGCRPRCGRRPTSPAVPGRAARMPAAGQQQRRQREAVRSKAVDPLLERHHRLPSKETVQPSGRYGREAAAGATTAPAHHDAALQVPLLPRHGGACCNRWVVEDGVRFRRLRAPLDSCRRRRGQGAVLCKSRPASPPAPRARHPRPSRTASLEPLSAAGASTFLAVASEAGLARNSTNLAGWRPSDLF